MSSAAAASPEPLRTSAGDGDPEPRTRGGRPDVDAREARAGDQRSDLLHRVEAVRRRRELRDSFLATFTKAEDQPTADPEHAPKFAQLLRRLRPEVQRVHRE